MKLITFTNARGEEITLDDTERTFLGELYGREGTEAPDLEYTEAQYADGATKILAITVKPRDIVLYFWAPAGTPILREKLTEIKQQLIQTGNSDDEWGDLMIRRADGRELHLSCAYTGGLNDFVREGWNWIKFSLTFHAEDPMFYDDFEQSYTIKQDDYSGYLFMAEDLYMDAAVLCESEADAQSETGESEAGNLYWENDEGEWYAIQPSDSLYMAAAESATGSSLYLNGEKAYPTIIINGPAENISLTHTKTGQKIEFSSSVVLDVNEKITIYTQPRKRKVTKKNKSGTTSNLMSYLSSDSSLNWWLVHGSNEIEFENSATTPESYLKFTYKEGFWSAE